MGGHVFISYAREDQTYTRKLAEDLQKHGFEIWIDDRIDFGDRWWQTIVQAICNSAAFVVVMTPDSEKSEWVERELLLAQRARKPIFPLLLRGQEFPLLITTQFVDVTNGQLPPEQFYARLGRIAPPQLKEEKTTPVLPQLAPHRSSGRLYLLAGIGTSILVVIIGMLAFIFFSMTNDNGREIDTKATLMALAAIATAQAQPGAGQPLPISTDTPTSTPTPTNTPTPVPTSTDTPELPTHTSTPSPTNTPEPTTNTPTSTYTPNPPTPTPSPTNTPTNTPVTPTNTPVTPTNTPIPQTITAPDGAPMVLVPAGPFEMGSNQGNSLEQPVHKVTLAAFYIDQYEVTNAQYRRCVEAGGCEQPACSEHYEDETKKNHPVVCVTWDQARQYCDWRGGRLPTEAEWEKAARGTDGRTYPWGNEFDGNRVNFCDSNCELDWAYEEYDDGYAETAPVGSYSNNVSPYGAYDLAGNVGEWVADWYDENYYATAPSYNPPGPVDGDSKVVRGGSWSYFAYELAVRVTGRGAGDYPDYQNDSLGFRCAADATE